MFLVQGTKTPVFWSKKLNGRRDAPSPPPLFEMEDVFVLPFPYFESKKSWLVNFMILGEHMDIERFQLEGKIVSFEFKDDIFSQ